MPRPCADYHADPSQTEQVCRLCWLDLHDASYRDFWRDGKKSAGTSAALPCIHRGGPTGEQVGCPTCRGNVNLKVYACAVHGTCTMGKRVAGRGCCDGACKERTT